MKWYTKLLFSITAPLSKQKLPPMKTAPTSTETFTEWFVRQKFRNFKAHEFTNYFERPLNTYPDRALWPSIIPTLRILDDLRDELNAPITITSSYRSPAYNRSVGGASASYHMKFNALDFQVHGYSPASIYQKLNILRNQDKFRGGLHSYPSFTHIDTRGVNSNW